MFEHEHEHENSSRNSSIHWGSWAKNAKKGIAAKRPAVAKAMAGKLQKAQKRGRVEVS
jgi:hypothetical protein